MTSGIVLEAIAAIEAGKKDQARELLVQAISQNQGDADAWYVMAAVVEEENQKIDCLENALKTNPGHLKARRALASLNAPKPKTRTRSKSKNKWVRWVLLAVLTLVTVAALGVFIRMVTHQGELPELLPAAQLGIQDPASTPTREPTDPPPTQTPTTPPPSATPTASPPTNTPIPTAADTAISLPFPCVPVSAPITAQVVRAVSGDTIEVLIGDQPFTVRYIGVASPTINLTYEQQATRYNQSLVAGNTVDLYFDRSDRDVDGRLLSYVFVGDAFVNYELIYNGLTFTEATPPNTACSATFNQAQEAAITMSLGLWQPTPTAPAVSLPSSVIQPPPICTCQKPDLECTDFETYAEAQACYQYCRSLGKGDYYWLDRDRDGHACEMLP